MTSCPPHFFQQSRFVLESTEALHESPGILGTAQDEPFDAGGDDLGCRGKRRKDYRPSTGHRFQNHIWKSVMKGLTGEQCEGVRFLEVAGHLLVRYPTRHAHVSGKAGLIYE